jgi:hypothetical protein
MNEEEFTELLGMMERKTRQIPICEKVYQHLEGTYHIVKKIELLT